MKPILIFTVVFIGILFIAASSIHAQPADATAWWLIADSISNVQSRENLDALVNLLQARGKVPSDQIHRIEGKACTRDGLHTALRNLARRMKREDRLILLLRAFVTKPISSNSIYFLTHGSTSENLATMLQDGQLNRWFRETKADETIFLFNGYTKDQNLYAYLANRDSLGEAALISIQPAQTEDSFISDLLSALRTDTSDLNDNRRLTLGELHEYLIAEAPPQEGISVPTGNMDADILKLSPMLKIATVPNGALVLLNGEEIGRTPQRLIDKLARSTYEIGVKKQGYIIPPLRTVSINLLQGEGVDASWTLEPIAVHGTVKPSANKTLERVKIWIEGTSYEQVIGADGNYRFGDWDAHGMLEIGVTYTLRAASEERYHADATFTFGGHESVQRELNLIEKTWFEVAQIRFDQKNNEGAIAAFQTGIEMTTELQTMSTGLEVMLFNSFSAAVDSMNIENIAYVVATAKLADRVGQKNLSKVYWVRVKSDAIKGSTEYKLATQRLWQLNLGRYLINIMLLILLIVVLISGGYTFHKQRKAKR